MVNVDNLHASGVAGFTGQERIVPSPSEERSHVVTVDNLHASGVAGFTGQERIVPSPSEDSTHGNRGDLHAFSAAGSTGQGSIASSPSARNGCTSWQSPHFGQRGWFVWDRRSASWVGIFGFVVLLFDTAC